MPCTVLGLTVIFFLCVTIFLVFVATRVFWYTEGAHLWGERWSVGRSVDRQQLKSLYNENNISKIFFE